MTEVEALRRYTETGDAEAFAQLVHQYQRLVYAACRRHLQDAADIEDATQETFLRLARRAGDVKTSLAGWLHTCAVRVSLDLIRRDASRRRTESVAAQERDLDEPTWLQLSADLDAALQEIDEASRELILCRFYEGQTQSQLAKAAEVSEATMHRRVQAAVDQLRSALADRGVTGTVMAGAAALAEVLAADAASAAVPASVTTAAVKAGLLGTAASGAAAGGVALAGPVKLIAGITAALAFVSTLVWLVLAQQPATPPPPAAPATPAALALPAQPQQGQRFDPALVQTRWRGVITRNGQTSPAWLAVGLGDYYLVDEATGEAWFGSMNYGDFDPEATVHDAALTVTNPDAPGPHPTAQARYQLQDGALQLLLASPGEALPAEASPSEAGALPGVARLQLQPTQEPLLHIVPFVDRNTNYGGYSFSAAGQNPHTSIRFAGVGFGQLLTTMHALKHPKRVRDVIGLLNNPNGYVGAVFADDADVVLSAWLQAQQPFRTQMVTRPTAVYRLVHEGGAAKPLEPTTSEGGRRRYSQRGGPYIWEGYTMEALADDLEWQVDRPVIDDTGLTDAYRYELPSDVVDHEQNGVVKAFEEYGLRLVEDTQPIEYLEILPANPKIGAADLIEGMWIDNNEVVQVEGDMITLFARGQPVFAAGLEEFTAADADQFAGTMRVRIAAAPNDEMVGLESRGRFRFHEGEFQLAMGRPGLDKVPADFTQSREVNVMKLRRLTADARTPQALRGLWRSDDAATTVEITSDQIVLRQGSSEQRLRLVGVDGDERNGDLDLLPATESGAASTDAPIKPHQLRLSHVNLHGDDLELAIGEPGGRRAYPRSRDGQTLTLKRVDPPVVR